VLGERRVKFKWWLWIALLTFGTLGEAVSASSLEYWKFNPDLGRLEIITDTAVRPQVQLIRNPTRLVIDLPGIDLNSPRTSKSVSSFVREVRVGQFDPQTTRIVVELSEEYSMRPWEVKVKGLSPNRWFVQFPKFLLTSSYSLPEDSIAISVPEVKAAPITGLVVVIDPGHGGRDPGAIGIGGLQEKNVVLAIALEVARILERQGIKVIMTRAGDRYVSLAGRVALAQRYNADTFVSIHANAIERSKSGVNGLETYYYSEGYNLARSIHRSILSRINVSDRGVRRARFYVLRKTSMPAILVEVGFVTGRIDNRNLARASYRQQMAEAIAAGIIQYLR
jgi:N-acetylmuramoyl-L-alanine amidase